MNPERTSIGRRLESLAGKEVGPSRWLVVDQDLIDAFARVTDDEQWIHVDPQRASAESPYGSTVAHGMLTLSLAPGLAIELLELESAPLVVNYGLNRVRFPAPLPAGKRIRLSLTVAEVQLVSGGVRPVLDVSIEAEGQEKPVCVAQLIFQVQE